MKSLFLCGQLTSVDQIWPGGQRVFSLAKATSSSVFKVNIFFSFFKSSITWHITWDISKIYIYLTYHPLKEHPESVGKKIKQLGLIVLINQPLLQHPRLSPRSSKTHSGFLLFVFLLTSLTSFVWKGQRILMNISHCQMVTQGHVNTPDLAWSKFPSVVPKMFFLKEPSSLGFFLKASLPAFMSTKRKLIGHAVQRATWNTLDRSFWWMSKISDLKSSCWF